MQHSSTLCHKHSRYSVLPVVLRLGVVESKVVGDLSLELLERGFLLLEMFASLLQLPAASHVWVVLVEEHLPESLVWIGLVCLGARGRCLW